MHRFFIEEQNIKNNEFAISGKIARQISAVLKMRAGEKIVLLDNLGNECLVEISEVKKHDISGKILNCEKKQENWRRISLYASILKKDNFEWVLQKCTEIGMAEFYPVICERTIKIKNEIPERWRDIVREAAEQSGRIFIPKIQEPQTFKKALESAGGQIFIAHEKETKPFSKEKLPDAINIFIGPEGGFSDKEISLAKERGVKTISLGPTVLRAETAAVVAATIASIE